MPFLDNKIFKIIAQIKNDMLDTVLYTNRF